MMRLVSAAFLLALAACSGRESNADRTADRLDNAADQSTPAAADLLENRADSVQRSGVVRGNESAPGGTVQDAMDDAGAAQANASR